MQESNLHGSQELASCTTTARPLQHNATGPRHRAFVMFLGSCYRGRVPCRKWVEFTPENNFFQREKHSEWDTNKKKKRLWLRHCHLWLSLLPGTTSAGLNPLQAYTCAYSLSKKDNAFLNLCCVRFPIECTTCGASAYQHTGILFTNTGRPRRQLIHRFSWRLRQVGNTQVGVKVPPHTIRYSEFTTL